VARSASVEAIEQLSRALAQLATLPATPALRREQIKLQVALLSPLMHVKGYAAPEPKAAVEQARLLIEQAEALGEPPEDPLLLFSVLRGLWVSALVASNTEAQLSLAAQLMALAKKQSATVPLMIAHPIMGISLLATGNLMQARRHFDQAIALYAPAEHRPMLTRFSVDIGVLSLTYRSRIMWLLGYPEAALADAERALVDAREIGHAVTLMQLLATASLTHALRGSYATASAQVDELVALTDEKGALYWKAVGIMLQGKLFALTGRALDAVQTLTSGIATMRSTGATLTVPESLSFLAMGHAELDQFDDAWRCIREAITTVEATKDRQWEAEVHRMAGEIALNSPEPNAVKAQAYFERALAIAREQQAKSWELRAAMSMARLWRDQGKRDGARDLLAPVYGWFAEGFDTLDLKQAKELLDELS
jgi:predicted ATPase